MKQDCEDKVPHIQFKTKRSPGAAELCEWLIGSWRLVLSAQWFLTKLQD